MRHSYRHTSSDSMCGREGRERERERREKEGGREGGGGGREWEGLVGVSRTCIDE